MARKKSEKGAQQHPDGPLVSIGPDERARVRDLRKAKGWIQGDVATRAGVTPATISNIESGRSRQIRRGVYARVLRALEKADDDYPSASDDEIFKAIVDGLIHLSTDKQKVVSDLVAALKKT